MHFGRWGGGGTTPKRPGPLSKYLHGDFSCENIYFVLILTQYQNALREYIVEFVQVDTSSFKGDWN